GVLFGAFEAAILEPERVQIECTRRGSAVQTPQPGFFTTFGLEVRLECRTYVFDLGVQGVRELIDERLIGEHGGMLSTAPRAHQLFAFGFGVYPLSPQRSDHTAVQELCRR